MKPDTSRTSVLKKHPPMEAFQADHARRLDAEEGSRALLEAVLRLAEKRLAA